MLKEGRWGGRERGKGRKRKSDGKWRKKKRREREQEEIKEGGRTAEIWRGGVRREEDIVSQNRGLEIRKLHDTLLITLWEKNQHRLPKQK